MAVVRSNEDLNKYVDGLDSANVKLTGNQTREMKLESLLGIAMPKFGKHKGTINE